MLRQVWLCLIILVHVLVFVFLLNPLQLLLESLLSLFVAPVEGVAANDLEELSQKIPRSLLVLLD